MNHNSALLSERMNIFAAGTWVSAEKFSRFLGVGIQALADAAETVTVQLRKATDAAGSNAANFGAAGSAASAATDSLIKAYADGLSADLGQSPGGLDYTHVSVTITDTATPEAASYGFLIAGDPRYGSDTLSGN